MVLYYINDIFASNLVHIPAGGALFPVYSYPDLYSILRFYKFLYNLTLSFIN